MAQDDVELVQNGENLVLSVSINGFKVNAMLDSGAGVSIIDKKTLDELRIPYELHEGKKHLYDASGNLMNVAGVTHFEVIIPGTKKLMNQLFYVFEGNDGSGKVLLGRDFMSQYGVVSFDFQNNRVKIKKKRG